MAQQKTRTFFDDMKDFIKEALGRIVAVEEKNASHDSRISSIESTINSGSPNQMVANALADHEGRLKRLEKNARQIPQSAETGSTATRETTIKENEK